MPETIRLLVCGGRDFSNADMVNGLLDAVHRKRGIAIIIEGGATGADQLARQWAKSQEVPFLTFEADWKTLGPKAGPIRNSQMIAEGCPDGVLAFPGGKGTADMIRKAKSAGLKVWEIAE